jgi:hypothetical protein
MASTHWSCHHCLLVMGSSPIVGIRPPLCLPSRAAPSRAATPLCGRARRARPSHHGARTPGEQMAAGRWHVYVLTRSARHGFEAHSRNTLPSASIARPIPSRPNSPFTSSSCAMSGRSSNPRTQQEVAAGPSKAAVRGFESCPPPERAAPPIAGLRGAVSIQRRLGSRRVGIHRDTWKTPRS